MPRIIPFLLTTLLYATKTAASPTTTSEKTLHHHGDTSILGAIHPPTYLVDSSTMSQKPLILYSENGGSITSFFKNNNQLLWRQISDNGNTILEGQFIKNEFGDFVLNGHGSRYFKDEQIHEFGIYHMGEPHLAVINFAKHYILDIGVRERGTLHGEICVKRESDGTQVIGTFLHGYLVDGYRGNTRITDYNEQNEFLFDKVPTLPGSYFSELETTTVNVEDGTITAFYLSSQPIYGKKIDRYGVIYIGFFNADGQAHGAGERKGATFTENGFFENGIFTYGRVDYENGDYEIGGRRATMLHGTNCRKYEYHMNKEYEGKFILGEFINPNKKPSPPKEAYQNGVAYLSSHPKQGMFLPDIVLFSDGEIYPYLPLNHISSIDKYGTHEFSINGISIAKGKPLGNNVCQREFETQLTPMLLQLEKVESLKNFLRNIEEITFHVFNAMKQKDTSKSQKIAQQLLDISESEIIKHTLHEIVSIKSRALESKKDILGSEEAQLLTQFLAQKIMTEMGEESARNYCLNTLKLLIYESEHVFSGTIGLARIESTLTENLHGLPLFSEFMTTLEPYIHDILPHVLIDISISIDTRTPPFLYAVSIEIGDTNRITQTIEAFLPGRQETFTSLIGYEIPSIMGSLHGLPLEAIKEFSGENPAYLISRGNFYRASEKTAEFLYNWHNCMVQAHEDSHIPVSLYKFGNT